MKKVHNFSIEIFAKLLIFLNVNYLTDLESIWRGIVGKESLIISRIIFQIGVHGFWKFISALNKLKKSHSFGMGFFPETVFSVLKQYTKFQLIFTPWIQHICIVDFSIFRIFDTIAIYTIILKERNQRMLSYLKKYKRNLLKWIKYNNHFLWLTIFKDQSVYLNKINTCPHTKKYKWHLFRLIIYKDSLFLFFFIVRLKLDRNFELNILSSYFCLQSADADVQISAAI